jgi:hypothetical protein
VGHFSFAFAEGKPQDPVEGLVDQGVELRRQGRDKDALTVFLTAQRIKDTPKVTAQIGLAEQALGLWLSSESHLETALAAARDAWIDANRKTIEAALHVVEGHIGKVDVWGSPAGAEILFDGQLVGHLPLETPIRVAQARLILEVRSPGYLPLSRIVDVRLGELSREAVELRASTSAGNLVQTSPTSSAAHLPPSSEASDSTSFYRHWWFWTTVGVLVAGAAATALALRSRRGDSSCPGDTTCGTWSSL